MLSIRHLACAAALLLPVPAQAHDIVRRADSTLPIASSVLVPAGYDTLFVGGTLAERGGDTAAQAHSVLDKIAAELEAHGFAPSDVVKMTVYLVGDPSRDGIADYAGLMSAYLKHFGKESGGLPVRTTVQVAGLAAPGALVQIDVTAARGGDH